MNAKDLKALIKALKEAGVTNFQDGDLKISFSQATKEETRQDPIPLDAPSLEEDPIKHKVEEMASLLKLSDADLVDRLFPDTENQEESA